MKRANIPFVAVTAVLLWVGSASAQTSGSGTGSGTGGTISPGGTRGAPAVGSTPTGPGTGGIDSSTKNRKTPFDSIAECENLWAPRTQMSQSDWAETCRRSENNLRGKE